MFSYLRLTFFLLIGGLFLHPTNAYPQDSMTQSANSEDRPVDDSVSLAENFLKDSFRLREQTQVVLDGSEAASGLTQNWKITNELVYLSPQKWRVRREIPYTQQTFEFLMTDKGVRLMNLFNEGSTPSYPVPAKTYVEVVLSPLRFAQQWKLFDASGDMGSLMKILRKGPLADKAGSQLELEEKDGVLSVKSSGKILHDGKTQVSVSSLWQMSERGKVSAAELQNSLVRSQ